MKKLLIALVVIAVIPAAAVSLAIMGLVLYLAPLMVSALAIGVLTLLGLFAVVKIRAGRNAAGSLDGEASLLPSARATGGLL